MVKLLLAALAAVLLLPAVAGAAPRPSFLHESEARLAQQHAGYTVKDRIGAFAIGFGSCVRRDRSSFDCGVSLWRVRYSIQEKCRLKVHVTASRRKGVRSVKWTGRTWCGLADPKVKEPAPQPAPKKPQPTYPDAPTR